MNLDQWLTNKKISVEEFGKILKCSGNTIRRYRTGERMPLVETVEEILTATNGAVKPVDIHKTRLDYVRSKSKRGLR